MAHEYELGTQGNSLDWYDERTRIADKLEEIFDREQVTALSVEVPGLATYIGIEADPRSVFTLLAKGRGAIVLRFNFDRKDGFDVTRSSGIDFGIPTETFKFDFANRCDDCSTVPCQCDYCEDCEWPLYEDVEHYCTRA